MKTDVIEEAIAELHPATRRAMALLALRGVRFEPGLHIRKGDALMSVGKDSKHTYADHDTFWWSYIMPGEQYGTQCGSLKVAVNNARNQMRKRDRMNNV